VNWVSEDTTVVQLFAALLTPTIAIFGGYVAWQQWQVNRANLKERLFERRMAIFKEAQGFLTEVNLNQSYTGESLLKFTDACQRARLLFGQPVQDYLFAIRAHAIKMRRYQNERDGVPIGPEQSDLLDKEEDEQKWLSEQITPPINNHITPLVETFAPFLSFKNH